MNTHVLNRPRMLIDFTFIVIIFIQEKCAHYRADNLSFFLSKKKKKKR